MNYIFCWAERFESGLAPHYPILYSIILGMEAKNVFEFGAGGSTRVILDALFKTEGRLISVSMESQEELMVKYGIRKEPIWTHHQMLSQEVFFRIPQESLFDFVLHDGSHSEDVVNDDIARIIPFMRKYSLLAVHDTQHSYSGRAVRKGLRSALNGICLSYTTLPFAFGLTLIRLEEDRLCEPFSVSKTKMGSSHSTILCPLYLER